MVAMEAWKREKYPSGRSRTTHPQAAQRYLGISAGSPYPSKQAVLYPCPHSFPSHLGQDGGLGQRYFRPSLKRLLTHTPTNTINRVRVVSFTHMFLGVKGAPTSFTPILFYDRFRPIPKARIIRHPTPSSQAFVKNTAPSRQHILPTNIGSLGASKTLGQETSFTEHWT